MFRNRYETRADAGRFQQFRLHMGTAGDALASGLSGYAFGNGIKIIPL